ncbi:hypothetical protein ASPSYDRAFT_52589 [Aspergillus sydowii CBS 593.65]|uniref:Uncharacterized protein n=1 Tax=Aspergillus sydowii CBS 593.65 TaxID=1036612 RepID=A0A1L9SXW3_9EURO|nr:uncharacterized protein ASPSYDRAFT_52589 [Aspergillus sydowii CBS 593.65]OJJ51986.1 hypothetical protein ASPSYDRAFT_52589 [Aspergillus sydowii CBS 593.65]
MLEDYSREESGDEFILRTQLWFPLLEQDAPEFSRQYGSLRRKLYGGRIWHMLDLEFGKSIVYFLPSRGEFEISTVRRVPKCHFDNFLEVLREKRGSFLRKCIE